MKKLFVALLLVLSCATWAAAQRIDFECTMTRFVEFNELGQRYSYGAGKTSYNCPGFIELIDEDFGNAQHVRIEIKPSADALKWYGQILSFTDKYGHIPGQIDLTLNGKVKRKNTYAFFNEDETESIELYTLMEQGKAAGLGIRKILNGEPLWMTFTPMDSHQLRSVYALLEKSVKCLHMRSVKIGN